ncbi:hypothetical protein SAMN04488128_102414 [Chitinophaga eiseniae]|uniref:Uncharacterized protein n=1 Tax=Chitinophaga eiseniae TaxID=634771 RepID=A0A1T4QK01_9BACT|nr:hypothetical protein SAMN04488128_102414 [Chitinophaga eiseniae]
MPEGYVAALTSDNQRQPQDRLHFVENGHSPADNRRIDDEMVLVDQPCRDERSNERYAPENDQVFPLLPLQRVHLFDKITCRQHGIGPVHPVQGVRKYYLAGIPDMPGKYGLRIGGVSRHPFPVADKALFGHFPAEQHVVCGSYQSGMVSLKGRVPGPCFSIIPHHPAAAPIDSSSKTVNRQLHL